MLPSLVAEDLRASLTSFLGTTFALGDDDVRAELERFVGDPQHGVFRGPFVRLRLPFRPADEGWRAALDWSPHEFRPHRHQADAWMRLASRDRIPRPTLVTTGTGSGKTESFLIPLLDHCRRQRRAGQHGIKALVLYPMNALANDQARRIARLVHEHVDELGPLTVGLYTGDSGGGMEMTETSVIGDRHVLRKSPPDILLTNYKMLDMMLLRSEDNPLFAGAGESLRYLVLDEFHTYDGAQGTDVAMLLRRLGMALGVTTEEQPLGAITPVATSATLGGGSEGGPKLREFAETVFGTVFEADSLVIEDRLTVDEWTASPWPSAGWAAAPGPRVPLLDEVTAALATATSHADQVAVGMRLFLGTAYLRNADLGERLARVLLCTFTRNLAADLEVDVRSLVQPDELPRIDVRGVDQVVRAVVQAVDGPPAAILGNGEQDTIWEDAVRVAAVPADLAPTLTPAFLAGEYRTVVLGMTEQNRDAYLHVKRPGRGVRLNRVQRAVVWTVVEAFMRSVASQGRTTFELLAARAAQILEDPESRIKAPGYDHVVVDEGQDLHAGHWRVLRRMVAPGPNDLFICEDGHQRIYGERTVLSRYGIETRGRSRRLTLNYRTSRQNLAFAIGVIDDQPVVDLEGEQDTVAGYHSTFTGPKPVTRGFPGIAEEMRFVVETVRGWLDAGVHPSSIAILARRTAEQDRVRIVLQEGGVAVELLQKEGAGNPSAVKIASMHRAKGTEFSRVIVVGAEAGVVPLDWVFENQPESEVSAQRDRERALFYVACSRARDELVVTWSGIPSPFLPQEAGRTNAQPA